ncbi:hypothetical protein [Sutcliffiella horikoshii]|uniref:hypothetical protein n=1 Tax=Sutcliffiella horikoshii TaxID=79883 RepID=UPI001653CCFF|nr:hypothetical protein [Sutcliffiella horikoshii]
MLTDRPQASEASGTEINRILNYLIVLKKGRISNVKLASSSSLLLTLYATKR